MVFRKRRLPGPEKLREIYLTDLLTGKEISEKYNVNRSYVYAELRRHKIHAKDAVNILVVCSYWRCKKKFRIIRCKIKKIRKKKGVFNHYCSTICYHKSRKSLYSFKTRTTYKSRRIVSAYLPFKLTSKMCVHHVNSNGSDLRLSNLMVFKNQSDHARFHHRTRINKTRPKSEQLKLPEPIWKGSDVEDWE